MVCAVCLSVFLWHGNYWRPFISNLLLEWTHCLKKSRVGHDAQVTSLWWSNPISKYYANAWFNKGTDVMRPSLSPTLIKHITFNWSAKICYHKGSWNGVNCTCSNSLTNDRKMPLLILILHVLDNMSCTCSYSWYEMQHSFSLSSPGQNGRHFPDDVFSCFFVIEMSLN